MRIRALRCPFHFFLKRIAGTKTYIHTTLGGAMFCMFMQRPPSELGFSIWPTPERSTVHDTHWGSFPREFRRVRGAREGALCTYSNDCNRSGSMGSCTAQAGLSRAIHTLAHGFVTRFYTREWAIPKKPDVYHIVVQASEQVLSKARTRPTGPSSECCRLSKRTRPHGCDRELVDRGTGFPVDGVPPGESVHRELELLVALGGATPLEARPMGTIRSAGILGFEGLLGVVDVGRLARLVVLTKNPLDDICFAENPFSAPHKDRETILGPAKNSNHLF